MRLVVLPVKYDGQSLTSSDAGSDGFIDTSFFPGDGLSYDNPSVDVNAGGGIMIGYHMEPFTTDGQPSAGGSFVSAGSQTPSNAVVQAGVASICTPSQFAGGKLSACRHTNDYTTTVVDPADDTGFWTALPYVDTNGNANNAAVLTSINQLTVTLF